MAGIEVRMERMRPGDVVARMKKVPLVLFPIGLIEWHGPHLPLGTDALNAEGFAIRLAERLRCVTMPVYYVGTERERRPEMLRSIGFDGNEYIEGMNFPKVGLYMVGIGM